MNREPSTLDIYRLMLMLALRLDRLVRTLQLTKSE